MIRKQPSLSIPSQVTSSYWTVQLMHLYSLVSASRLAYENSEPVSKAPYINCPGGKPGSTVK